MKARITPVKLTEKGAKVRYFPDEDKSYRANRKEYRNYIHKRKKNEKRGG